MLYQKVRHPAKSQPSIMGMKASRTSQPHVDQSTILEYEWANTKKIEFPRWAQPCNTVIYNKKYLFGLVSISGAS